LHAPTQVLGNIVHDLGPIEALRVPSARDPSTENLVILQIVSSRQARCACSMTPA
jgi:hypothetical protein